MRKLLAAAAALVLASAPMSSGDPGPGYLEATSNVSYLGTFANEADTAGARLLGKTFYVLTAKGLTIYDVSNPTLPVPLGFTPLPHTPNQEREDVDTDGKILIAGQSYTGLLYVVDVSDPRLPRLRSTLRNAAGHTNTCVLKCTWVYSSDGDIIDVRNPDAPKLAGKWQDAAGVRGSHDWTEVSPGLLMGATNPVVYLDARKNPAKPKLIGQGLVPDSRYIHGNLWPRGGKDRWLLVGSESDMMCGNPKEGSFMVYDTKPFAKTKRFKYMGDYSLQHGMPTEGKAEVNQHCGHWFQPHPTFKDGGLVAVAWYGFGTRFVEVTKTGKVVERGYFLGGGQASSAYWMNNDIVYSLDYVRGIDILKFDRTKKPTSSGLGTWNERRPGLTFLSREPVRDGTSFVCPAPAPRQL
ncbi:MAG TPA: hypothetical protein VNA20_01550 [Frankiaceae bacterium]|nr:hypothetical protein [Frankiaceae bacterium]